MKRRGRPPYPDVLTPRQQEVLELLRDGLTNGEIARELGISSDGAKFHVSEIIGRVGVTSREEAAQWQPDRQPAGVPTAALAWGISRFRPLAVQATLHRSLRASRGHRASGCRARTGRIAA